MKDSWKKVINTKNGSIAGKILMTVVTVAMVIMFFADRTMYTETTDGGKTYVGRIVAVILLAALEITLLYIKNRLSEKINMVLTLIFWFISIPGLFMLLEYSQGFEIFRLGFLDLRYNLYIIFALLLCFYAITNSFRYSVLLNSIVVCALGLTNYYLIQFRGTSLLATDIYTVETAINVAGNYSYALNYTCFILLFGTIIIGTMSAKLNKFTLLKKWKRSIAVALAVVATAFVLYQTIFNTQYEKTWKIKMFRPQVSNSRHGTMLMFVHSFRYNFVDKPEGYSVKAVEEIAKNYSGEEATTEKKPNIIVIMNEAFSDLTQIGDFQMSEDCMPFYHSLKDNAVKGKLFVSVCAGGTATTEFEVVTSNAAAFTPLKSSPYQIYINDPMPSLATTLKDQGYTGITAMHPYKGRGYKRDKVYPLLGFNEFLTINDFDNPEKIRNFTSDKADFDRVIEEYEKSKANSDAPYFMFNVTMQNHSDYDKVWDNLSMDITLSGDISNKKSSIYVNLIKQTDNALKGLIEYFEKVDEPTIIVFFGDHQPRIGKNFYKDVLKTSPMDEEYKDLYNYFTEFVIWANYDIEEKEDVWISANYLGAMTLDVAGVAKTGYQQYVLDVMKDVPVITQLGYIGADGKFYKNGNKKSPYYDKVTEYNIVEYNNLFDSKNRISGFFDIN